MVTCCPVTSSAKTGTVPAKRAIKMLRVNVFPQHFFMIFPPYALSIRTSTRTGSSRRLPGSKSGPHEVRRTGRSWHRRRNFSPVSLRLYLAVGRRSSHLGKSIEICFSHIKKASIIRRSQPFTQCFILFIDSPVAGSVFRTKPCFLWCHDITFCFITLE